MAAATASAPSDGSSVFLTTTMPSTSYLTPATYDDVVSQTLGLASNPSAIMTFESRRSQACGLIAAVGAKVGLPQRTVDTAFVLWHKFTIYHGASSGNAGQHVAQAALFLACKLNDTPKKSRELILASYPLRYPELVRTAAAAAATATSTAGSKGVAPPPQLQNPALANLQESDVDSQLIDSERNKVLHLERAMLDALGYDFKIRQGVESVSRSIVKLGRAWKLSKALIQSAWRIASDIHRTPCPLVHTPVTIALAALLAAALLWPAPSEGVEEVEGVATVKGMFGLVAREPPPVQQEQDVTMAEVTHEGAPNGNGASSSPSTKNLQEHAQRWLADEALWERELGSYAAGVEEVVHSLLDLYISSASTFAQQQQMHLKTLEQHAVSTGAGVGGGPGSNSSPTTTASSPASPLNTTISPSSPSEYAGGLGGLAAANSASASSARKQQSLILPSYAVNPPPLGIIDCFAQHRRGGGAGFSANGNGLAAGANPTAISSALAKDLTDVKIQLRQVEDARRQRLAESSAADGESSDQIRRLRLIDEEARRVQVLRVQVVQQQQQQPAGDGATSALGQPATQTPSRDAPAGPMAGGGLAGAGSADSAIVPSSASTPGGAGTTTMVFTAPAGSAPAANATAANGAPSGSSAAVGSSGRPSVKTARFLF